MQKHLKLEIKPASLDWQNLLSNGTPLQCSCLENPMDGGAYGLQSMGLLGVGHNWASSLSLSCIGEGNGNPHQYSCLENPRDRGAWWAAIYGVAQSRTQLKQLSSSSSSSSSELFCASKFPFTFLIWTHYFSSLICSSALSPLMSSGLLQATQCLLTLCVHPIPESQCIFR